MILMTLDHWVVSCFPGFRQLRLPFLPAARYSRDRYRGEFRSTGLLPWSIFAKT